MRVFNLTNKDLSWHGKLIPPNGGSLEFQDMDDFISNSDKRYAENKVVAFGSLPKWWVLKKKAAKPVPVKPAVPVVPVVTKEVAKPDKPLGLKEIKEPKEKKK